MSDVDIELDTHEDEEHTPKVRKGGASKANLKKVRLNLLEDEEGSLLSLQNALRDRGLKNYDLSETVSEALATIPQEWWKAKLEDLTPLEWKVQAALDNPDMREKLVTLLEGR